MHQMKNKDHAYKGIQQAWHASKMLQRTRGSAAITVHEHGLPPKPFSNRSVAAQSDEKLTLANAEQLGQNG